MFFLTSRYWRVLSLYFKKLWAYILSLLIVLVIYLDASNQGTYLAVKKCVTDKLATPVGIINNSFSTVYDSFGFIKDLSKLNKENKYLREQKHKLEYYYLLTKHLDQENKDLQKLLNAVADKKFKFKTVRAAYLVDNSFNKILYLNGGEEDGIKKNQIVLHNNGLVGRIIEVGSNFAKVLLVTDFNSRIPVITEKSRERGVAVGERFETLNLEYIPEDNSIEEGELVFTSAEIDNFPSGILIGAISKKNGSDIQIKPAINSRNLNFVIVLVN
ncbi:rod shape-determining protein MreC [Rickettsiales endosymbiont of Stachyamoeba lipophora]|uniref:rod shape-determining protein MreC n=1 Tax=Rickettsiales endosymbiont of Stachyamoeba lipophora TaxID=2486578 RepID=UPI000F65444C|nr:rod shape-determining protein MreC [Rickettsiales endosymbiont of Stachyamoeba lipophora]AZL15098.1 rod shape-determining protein MreC [Rickettsiales endosymbiont of Stachyamoeba lipophora]